MKRLSKDIVESIFIATYVILTCTVVYVTRVKSYSEGFKDGAEKMMFAVTDTLNNMVKQKQLIDTITINKYNWRVKIERLDGTTN